MWLGHDFGSISVLMTNSPGPMHAGHADLQINPELEAAIPASIPVNAKEAATGGLFLEPATGVADWAGELALN